MRYRARFLTPLVATPLSDGKNWRLAKALRFEDTHGAVHCVPDAQHYDRVMAKCGRKYWVLQPKRNGELKLFPWPGPALTRAEMKAREEAEK